MKIDIGSKYNVILQAALNHVNPNALINTSFPIKKILPLVHKWSHLLASPYWNWTVESLCFRFWTSTWSHCWVCQTASLDLVNVGPEVHTIQLRAPELSEYKDQFDAHTIGKLPVLYHIWIDDSVPLAVCAPRCVPLAIKYKIMIIILQGVKCSNDAWNSFLQDYHARS